MYKIVTKFVMWCVIGLIALPAFILTMPAKAQAAHVIEAPVTRLTTSPKKPNANGWFDQVVLIKLNPDQDSKSYFQWNSINGTWTEYQEAIRAWKGENTLYYYSVNADGAKEAIQNTMIKMDYGHPANPDIQVANAQAQVKIVWDTPKNLVAMKITKDGDNLVTTPAQIGYYFDQDVKVNDTYLYKIKAVNAAGWKSKAVKTSVIVSAAPAPKVLKSIGQGVMTTAVAEKVASVQTAKVEPKEEAPATTNPESAPIKNWSRLFIALSILIIAAGAAIAGYYGYEWWMSRRENSEEETRTKKTNRW